MAKTETELRLNSSEYNSATSKTMGNHEIWNTAANWQTIMQMFKTGRAKDIKEEPKKNKEPCIIPGSGPSLDNTIDMLKDWDGGILCHYSQAVSLVAKGVEPDYIMALDALCNWEGIKDVDWSKTKTKLISHPGMYPSLIENWPNEILFYRQNFGKRNSFQGKHQRVMYSEHLETLEEALAGNIKLKTLIQTEITMFACTPPAQLIAGEILGYGTLFLTGLDFAYTNDKMRFTGFSKVDGVWEGKAHPIFEDTSNFFLTENGFFTEKLHLYYKKNFLSALRLTLQNCWTTDIGAVTEIPYTPMDKVIESQGHGFKPVRREMFIRDLERYLASVGCYVINYKVGCGFVESEHIEQLVEYMNRQNRSYVCEGCGAEAVSNDGKDHTGFVCQKCKVGKMKVNNPIDVEKNRKRFQKLMDYTGAKK